MLPVGLGETAGDGAPARRRRRQQRPRRATISIQGCNDLSGKLDTSSFPLHLGEKPLLMRRDFSRSGKQPVCPSVNKYYTLLSLCCCKMLPLIVKPKTAAGPSAGLLAAMIYGLEETTEAPSCHHCLLCLAQKPAGSCQAQLEREGRGKGPSLLPRRYFPAPAEALGGQRGWYPPSAGLGMVQSWYE